MDKISKLYFREGQKDFHKEAIGLEIEVELNRAFPDVPIKAFVVDYDGSLQGESRELILKKPVPLMGLQTAINSLPKLAIKISTGS